jgi:hypothetical protein
VHPAILRIARILAEVEAAQLCNEQKESPEAAKPPGRKEDRTETRPLGEGGDHNN